MKRSLATICLTLVLLVVQSLATKVLVLWSPAIAGEINNIQIAQSKIQADSASGKLNGTWMTEKQSPDSDNSPECEFDWKIDKAVISGENMSLFLTGKNKQQVVSGKINTEKMDFDADQKLSVEFTDGTSEINVQFAGKFSWGEFNGWYMGAYTEEGLGRDTGNRYQCSGDFTLVSASKLERKAIKAPYWTGYKSQIITNESSNSASSGLPATLQIEYSKDGQTYTAQWHYDNEHGGTGECSGKVDEFGKLETTECTPDQKNNLRELGGTVSQIEIAYDGRMSAPVWRVKGMAEHRSRIAKRTLKDQPKKLEEANAETERQAETARQKQEEETRQTAERQRPAEAATLPFAMEGIAYSGNQRLKLVLTKKTADRYFGGQAPYLVTGELTEDGNIFEIDCGELTPSNKQPLSFGNTTNNCISKTREFDAKAFPKLKVAGLVMRLSEFSFRTASGQTRFDDIQVTFISNQGFDGEWVGTLKGEDKDVCGFESHPIKAIVKGTNLTIITRDYDSDVTLKGEIGSKGEVEFSGKSREWQYMHTYKGFVSHTTAEIEGQFDENKFNGSIVSRYHKGCYSNFTMKRKIDPTQIASEKKEQERVSVEQTRKIEETNVEEKRQAEKARQMAEAKRLAKEKRQFDQIARVEKEKRLYVELSGSTRQYLATVQRFLADNPDTPSLMTIVSQTAVVHSALKKGSGTGIRTGLKTLKRTLSREKGFAKFAAAIEAGRQKKIAAAARMRREKLAADVRKNREELRSYAKFLKSEMIRNISNTGLTSILIPLAKELQGGLKSEDPALMSSLRNRVVATLKKLGLNEQYSQVKKMMAEVQKAARTKAANERRRMAAEKKARAVAVRQKAEATRTRKRDRALAAAQEKYRDAVAVVIGNRKYGNRVPAVAFAHNDASAMRKYLIGLGYRAGNIIFITDATQAQLMAVFGTKESHRGKLFSYVRPGESDVTVFYSGHGVPSLKNRRGYLLPVDADPNLVELNGYPIDLLYSNLGKIPAKSIRVYMDACFSGDSPNGMLVRAASGLSITPKMPKKRASSTMISITAAQGDQFASWDEDAEHGLFTKHLLEALNGMADKSRYGNGDGKVTLGEIKKYLDREMTYQARRRYNRDQMATVSGDRKLVLSQYR